MMLLQRHFSTSILVMAWLTVPGFAQSHFTIAPSQIPGLRVEGPETSAFTTYISGLGIDDEVRTAAADYLSHAILLTNLTERNVSKLVVRFEYLNPGGRMARFTLWQEPNDFGPGMSRLVTITPALTEGIRTRTKDLALRAIQGSLSGSIVRSPIVNVSVDSVVFANGDFYGPDLSGAWAMRVEEQEFVKATRTEFERIGPDIERIRQKLYDLHTPVVEGRPIPGEGRLVRLMREKMYAELTYALRDGYESFRLALEDRFGEQSRAVLNRRF